MRHTLLFVVVLAVCFTAGASATGPGGWSRVGGGAKAGTASLNGAVYALNADAPGLLYVGGAFTSAGGNPKASQIASWNGAKWARVGSPALNGAVHAIAVHAGKVYAGGVFTNAGGNANADFLAEWDGGSWKPFCNSVNAGPPITANVMALQIIGNTLYVGGSFQNGAGLKTADYLVACDLTTGNASSLVTRDGDVAGAVYALTADSNGTLYAAGQFIDMAGNRASDHVAAYAGGLWRQMGSGPSNGGGALIDYARAITAHGTDVYVGTDSLDIGGIAQADHVAKWNGSAWSAMGADAAGTNGWFPASTFINAMTTSGSRVFVAGSFQNANGDPRADNIAVFDGTAWHALGSSGAGNGPWIGNGLALAAFGKLLYAGGSFTSAGGDTLAEYLASYPLVPDTTPPTMSAYTVAPGTFARSKSATVRYRLSEAAKVLFTVQRAGRKVSGFTRAGHVGVNSFALAGKGRKPGAYSLAAVAVDAAGNKSAKLARPFRVTG